MSRNELTTGGAVVSASNPLPTSLAISLDSTTDSIDVDKMSKGSVTTAHNGISGTATSSEIDVRGYNAVYVEVAISGSGDWDIEMTGCAVSGGTFVSQYVGTVQLIRQAITASVGFIFPVGANYIKIVATENSGTATVTVKVTPLTTSAPLPASLGDITVENVAITSIAAGDNNIGNMDIVTLPGTVETDITAIKTAAELIDNAISESEMQVDVVAALPAGDNNIGNMDIASEIPAGTQIIGKVGIDQTTDETTNKVRCFPGTSTEWDVSDRAARDLGKADIAGIDAVGAIAGQKVMSASIPVVVASDQSGYQGKGSVTTAHNGISGTATSSEINCLGYNGILLNCEGTLESGQTWTVEVLGCAVTSGNVGKSYQSDNFEMKTDITYADISADGVVNLSFKGVQNYIKIRATLSGGTATLTCRVTPVNL